MKLLVQEFLETHTFKELQEQHGVYASFSKSGHKWSNNYDQLEAKESDPLSQECRGLVLSAEDGHSFTSQAVEVNGRLSYDHICPGKTKIISFPMKRFFNNGQGSAADINWADPNLSILEKLDGTLCITGFDPFTKAWCVSTRSVSEADLFMDNGIFTFRTLFEKALKETCGLDFDEFTKGLNVNVTYCFELTTPYNRIVVNYPECRVTLLAARNIIDHKEIYLSGIGDSLKWVDYDKLGQQTKDHLTSLGKTKENTPQAMIPVPYTLQGVPIVKSYTYSSLEDIVNWVSSLNPLEHEGVVIRDSNFNRIKVKNAAYIVYNKLHDRLGSSERNLMEFILLETDDDIISALAPEIGINMLKIKSGLQSTIMKYDGVYNLMMMALKALGEEKSKKEFALLVVKNHPTMWSAPFYQMFNGKVSNMKDFIQKNKKEGTWSDSFLDKLLGFCKENYIEP